MLKIADKIAFLISIAAMTGLLTAYVSPRVDPNTCVFPSLLGLAYPYLLIGNLLLLVYWIVRWKKKAWLELGVLLSGLPAFTDYYGTAGTRTEGRHADLSLLSYNIRYFDIYHWSRQKDTRTRLFDYLNRFDGELLCLQEFSMKASSAHEKEILRKLKSYPYHHIRKDMAIFSRLPILRKGNLSFGKNGSGSCIFCDLPVGKDTVRVYSVHLESYKLGQKERQFMQEINRSLKNGGFLENARSLTARLATANRNRARQAEQLREHIARSPYKVVVCGDFNSPPLSYPYQKIKGRLLDSFIEKGRGIGNTYIGEFPSFRIDYILHTPELETVGYVRDTVALSDHYPILGKLRLKNKK